MSENATDAKTQLIDNLKELHLPAMRSGEAGRSEVAGSDDRSEHEAAVRVRPQHLHGDQESEQLRRGP